MHVSVLVVQLAKNMDGFPCSILFSRSLLAMLFLFIIIIIRHSRAFSISDCCNGRRMILEMIEALFRIMGGRYAFVLGRFQWLHWILSSVIKNRLLLSQYWIWFLDSYMSIFRTVEFILGSVHPRTMKSAYVEFIFGTVIGVFTLCNPFLFIELIDYRNYMCDVYKKGLTNYTRTGTNHLLRGP